MACNIEIKARIESVEVMAPKAAAIANEGPIEIKQDDTFFHCDNGRLKLREFASDSGELIFYRRSDQPGPKESFYLRSPTSTPDILRDSLSLAYGQAGRVRKQRFLYLAGRTRIHLDNVEKLGHFLELEVVLSDNDSTEAGIEEAQQLMRNLEIIESQLIEDSYIDLIKKIRN